MLKLCEIQAALLEPEIRGDAQGETGDEEELVDFDADEVMEEPEEQASLDPAS